MATDGCVAVANPDLDRIIRTVEIQTTPVLIGKNLTWVRPSNLSSERKMFADTLQAWAQTKKNGKEGDLLKFYARDFSADGKDLTKFGRNLRKELANLRKRPVQLNDISLIRWSDEAEIMVATFGEIIAGEKTGRTVRQYWQRRSNVWRIIYEGAVG